MKIKRIILLIFAVLLLFSACSINKEYNEMLTQIETQEISLLQFASDIDKAINNNEKPYDLLLSC